MRIISPRITGSFSEKMKKAAENEGVATVGRKDKEYQVGLALTQGERRKEHRGSAHPALRETNKKTKKVRAT